jgi:NADPH:quinone reductase-like Zn-dependent oxidoreductase
VGRCRLWTRSDSTPRARCTSPAHRDCIFIRTRDEFTWRTNRLFDAIATGTVKVNVSSHYPLNDAAQAHRDLESRRTVGSVILTP